MTFESLCAACRRRGWIASPAPRRCRSPSACSSAGCASSSSAVANSRPAPAAARPPAASAAGASGRAGDGRRCRPPPPSPDPRVGLAAGRTRRRRSRLEHAGGFEHAAVGKVRRRPPTPISPSPASTPSRATTTASRCGTSPIPPSQRWHRPTPAARRRATSRSTRTCCSCPARPRPGGLDCGMQGVPEPVSKDRLRGIRIFDVTDMAQPEVRGQRADLPRLAHPHCGDGPEGQSERLHLRVRARRAFGRRRSCRAAWTARSTTRTRRASASRSSMCRSRRRSRRRSSARRASSTASPAPPRHADPPGTGRGGRGTRPRPVRQRRRQPPQGLPGRRSRRAGADWRCAGIASDAARGGSRRGTGRCRRPRPRRRTAGRTGPNQCHDITVYPGDRPRRRRLRRLRTPARHPRRRQPEAHRRGVRREHVVLALGDLQQRRIEDPVHGRMGRRYRSRAAATPTSPSGAPTRSSRSSTTR